MSANARVRSEPLDLPLRDPFGISRRTTAVAQNVLVRVEWQGLEGVGESAPNPYYGESQQSVLALAPRLAECLAEDPLAIRHTVEALQRMTRADPAARAGLELALWDLLGKMHAAPIWRLWGLGGALPLSSFTIGIDTPERMAEKATAASEFPMLKVKIGAPNDVENLRAVREARPDAVIRVDANGAWTAEEALASLEALEPLRLELVEQPVKAEDLEGLERVSRGSGLPVYADESCLTAADVPRLAGRCVGVVVKLQKAGGLLRALEQVYTARASGLKVMLGCMVESGLGISAAAQIAPLCDTLDLDGNLLLAADPFDGVAARGGQLELPLKPGLGATLRDS